MGGSRVTLWVLTARAAWQAPTEGGGSRDEPQSGGRRRLLPYLLRSPRGMMAVGEGLSSEHEGAAYQAVWGVPVLTHFTPLPTPPLESMLGIFLVFFPLTIPMEFSFVKDSLSMRAPAAQ